MEIKEIQSRLRQIESDLIDKGYRAEAQLHIEGDRFVAYVRYGAETLWGDDSDSVITRGDTPSATFEAASVEIAAIEGCQEREASEAMTQIGRGIDRLRAAGVHDPIVDTISENIRKLSGNILTDGRAA